MYGRLLFIASGRGVFERFKEDEHLARRSMRLRYYLPLGKSGKPRLGYQNDRLGQTNHHPRGEVLQEVLPIV